MKLNYIRSGFFASALAAVVTVNMDSPLLVHAEDFIGETSYEFTEETGTSFKANYRQIKPSTGFNCAGTITIPGYEYQNIINNEIMSIPVYKGIPSGAQVTLTGLNNLEGSIEYTITSTLPISDNQNLSNLVNCSGYGIESYSANWVYEHGKAIGIKVIAKIDWGKLINSLPYLEEFTNTSPSPLEFNVEVNGLKLADPDKLDNGTPFTLTGTVNSYTLTTNDNEIAISYTKSELNEHKFPIVKPYSQGTKFTRKVDTNLPSSYTNISIGPKNIHSNTSSSISNTRPNKPSIGNNSTDDRMIVLRLYNPNTGEHLFTTNAAERVQLVSIGWENEFCEWDTPAKSDIPIYRLCNPNNGDHHYTTNSEEKDMLVQLGWRYEGAPFYSAEKGEGLPVYRLYNPNATGVGSHHYTSSQDERDALSNYGWKYEGIAWFGLLKEE